MTKSCRQCTTSFEITEDDLKFYEKVSPVFNGKKYQIPSPTLCPECRQQRRLSFRNERNLYERNCAKTGEKIISNYSSEKKHRVYSQEEWWKDSWDPLSYGISVNEESPFFRQFDKLLSEVPRIGLFYYFSENAKYTNHCYHNKNCYLVFNSAYCENVSYSSNLMIHCNNCIDCMTVEKGEVLYGCLYVKNSFNSSFLVHCNGCDTSDFLYDCRGCSHCFMSSNLRNKQYYFQNIAYKREEYEQLVQSYKPFTHANLQKAKQQFYAMIQKKAIHKNLCVENSEHVSGDYIFASKNIHTCFYADKCEDITYCYDALGNKDCYDTYESSINVELQYECYGCNETSNACFCIVTQNCYRTLYCDYCFNCKNCFGCIGLRHKEYCILNKQYTKEEYEQLVPRIIEKMIADGEWGEFFPPSLSPFGYNETVAQEYFPLTKEEALKKGFNWSDYVPPPPNVEKILTKEQMKKLPDTIKDIPDDILNWALTCEVTGKPFKIIKPELKFYREHNLPIPRRHPDQRHRDRMALRNPRKLWTRQCMKCNKEIQTTYSPDRPEMVYCEKCYLDAVY